MTSALRTSTALLWILCGCGGGLSQLPGDGGPAWIELESQHFVLQTDLEPDDARAMLEHAERLFAGLLQAGWPSGGVIHLRLNLVVFADRRDFEQFGAGLGGYFVSEALLEPLVVMPAPTAAGFETLAHELTHYIAAQSLQNQPAWLAEGLASYYQTARFDDAGHFVIGGVPRGLHRVLEERGRMPCDRLMSPDTDPHDGFRYYPSAWLLTHYLMSRRQDAFASYLQALDRGLGHEQAWPLAFGALHQAELDRLLSSYWYAGSYDNFSLEVPAARPPGAPRPLENADVAALRALLYSTCRVCKDARKRARDYVNRALRERPLHLRATAMQLLHEKSPPDPAKARSLSQAHPDAWLPYLVLALAQSNAGGSPRESLALVSRTLELAPHQPYALMMAALYHAQLGERAVALARADEASALQPTNFRLLAMRLNVLSMIGECELLDLDARKLRNLVHQRLSQDSRGLERLGAACAQRRVAAAGERGMASGSEGGADEAAGTSPAAAP